MNSVSIAGFRRYLDRRLHLASYFQHPGDGREQPQIGAGVLVWSLIARFVLREWSFAAIEALVGSPARRALGVLRRFSDDTLDYFTERLSPEPTRNAAHAVLRRAKRNKAFWSSVRIGFAVDGTATGGSAEPHCPLCRPQVNAEHEVVGYDHRLSLISVVGTGLSLPFDIEPYGPGDSEYAASQRLLQRSVEGLGRHFADYVVADGAYAAAPLSPRCR